MESEVPAYKGNSISRICGVVAILEHLHPDNSDQRPLTSSCGLGVTVTQLYVMAPYITQPEPTEASPLLGKPDQNEQAILPAGPELHNADEDGTEPDPERQPSNGENFKHQGLPEVKKRMKYIFPAIAIGVSGPRTLGPDTILNNLGLPFCCGPDAYRINLWNHRHRSQGSLFNILDCNRLFPNSDRMPAPLWKAERHLWSQRMPAIRISHLRDRRHVVRLCALDWRTHRGQSFGRYRWRRHDRLRKHIAV